MMLRKQIKGQKGKLDEEFKKLKKRLIARVREDPRWQLEEVEGEGQGVVEVQEEVGEEGGSKGGQGAGGGSHRVCGKRGSCHSNVINPKL